MKRPVFTTKVLLQKETCCVHTIESLRKKGGNTPHPNLTADPRQTKTKETHDISAQNSTMYKEKHRPWPGGVCFIDAGMVQYLKISHSSLSRERVKKNIGSSAFDKFKTCPVHEKDFQKSRRGHFFSLINSICKSPRAGSRSREIRSMPGMSALTDLTQQGAGSPSQGPTARKCNKRHAERKK